MHVRLVVPADWTVRSDSGLSLSKLDGVTYNQGSGTISDAAQINVEHVDATPCGQISGSSDWTLANTDANCFLSLGTLNPVSGAPTTQTLAGVVWQRAEFIHPPGQSTAIAEHVVVFAVHHNGMAYVIATACADSVWATIYPTWIMPILSTLQFTQ
ncbi:MAG TPA: hypothetical protein VGN32_21825 [Ktedonobacterales bacterium]|nr:hypothetical protein [Ktedonobacterales bacterium]